jgi:uncharacterized protein YukE
MADHWSVAAEAGDLAATSAAWGTVLKSHDALVAGWSAGAREVLGSRWSGAAAKAYAVHRAALEKDLHGCVDLAGQVASALGKASDAVSAAQRALDGHFAVLSGVLDVRPAERGVRFRPQSVSDMETMRVAVGQAARVREELKKVLDRQAKAIAATVADWDRVARTWRENAEGEPAFSTPAEAVATLVLATGDAIVISTGSGDDQVSVRVDPVTGEQIVTSGAGVWRFAPNADLVVRTGSGSDTVVVAPGTHVRLTVIGGEGADALIGGAGDDILLGLGGNDYLNGNAGADLIDGGAGNDAEYGLGGDDVLVGAAGRDVLNGGAGNDDLSGEDGDDVVSGGDGADRLSGGAGTDIAYTGSGSDQVQGTETAYATKEATVESGRTVNVQIADLSKHIQIDGTPEFAERVQSDLDLLRSSPTGQRMLAALDHGLSGRDTLTIREFAEDNASAWPDVSPAAGRQRAIDYNPAFNTFLGDTPPVVVLYHEMAHTYDFVNGTTLSGVHTDPAYPDGPGVPNAERQAVGLPVDDDHDPQTPSRIDPRHPMPFTENGLRAELTWAPRAKYAD